MHRTLFFLACNFLLLWQAATGDLQEENKDRRFRHHLRADRGTRHAAKLQDAAVDDAAKRVRGMVTKKERSAASGRNAMAMITRTTDENKGNSISIPVLEDQATLASSFIKRQQRGRRQQQEEQRSLEQTFLQKLIKQKNSGDDEERQGFGFFSGNAGDTDDAPPAAVVAATGGGGGGGNGNNNNNNNKKKDKKNNNGTNARQNDSDCRSTGREGFFGGTKKGQKKKNGSSRSGGSKGKGKGKGGGSSRSGRNKGRNGRNKGRSSLSASGRRACGERAGTNKGKKKKLTRLGKYVVETDEKIDLYFNSRDDGTETAHLQWQKTIEQHHHS